MSHYITVEAMALTGGRRMRTEEEIREKIEQYYELPAEFILKDFNIGFICALRWVLESEVNNDR